MLEKIAQIWRTKDVRNNVLFVIAMLIVFRLVAHIPVPGVNVLALQQYLAGNQVLGLLNIFSGGTLQNFSVVMLGVGPYITASIIVQLLTIIVPSLEEISKEGESGQQKINMYTRWLTVPLALLQAYAMIRLFAQSGQNILGVMTSARVIALILTATAGTMFLVWLGELISERKVGNGMSLLIFAGIMASLPGTLSTIYFNYDPSMLYTYILFGVAAILMIVGVVFISEGQRNIPVVYAKQVRGNNRMQGGATTHLPFRVNMAGVVPIIFAVSLVNFPPILAQFFANANAQWMRTMATTMVQVFQSNTWTYGIIYFLLIFGFTYFYTSIIFHPQKIAENLQKQGGFVPGIRPGKETENYLMKTMNRLNFVGALFLGVVALLPLVAQAIAGTKSLTIGGTSMLIVVAVAIETAKQIEAQLTMHQYDTV